MGYYRLFTTVFDHHLLKCDLNDEIFAPIIPDLAAANFRMNELINHF
jgi:hypothetical protein